MAKRVRQRLFLANPCCFYCGVLTVLTGRGGRLPPNAATIEHLFPRCHPKRREIPQPGEIRLVNACHKCNSGKSVRDVRDHVGREGEFWRSMGPKNWKSWGESRIKDVNTFDCF